MLTQNIWCWWAGGVPWCHHFVGSNPHGCYHFVGVPIPFCGGYAGHPTLWCSHRLGANFKGDTYIYIYIYIYIYFQMICQKLGQICVRVGITRSKVISFLVTWGFFRTPPSLPTSPAGPLWQGSFEGRRRSCSKDFAAGASGLQTNSLWLIGFRHIRDFLGLHQKQSDCNILQLHSCLARLARRTSLQWLRVDSAWIEFLNCGLVKQTGDQSWAPWKLDDWDVYLFQKFDAQPYSR